MGINYTESTMPEIYYRDTGVGTPFHEKISKEFVSKKRAAGFEIDDNPEFCDYQNDPILEEILSEYTVLPDIGGYEIPGTVLYPLAVIIMAIRRIRGRD